MNTAFRIALVVCAASAAMSCKTIDQRYYYRQGIAALDRDKKIPANNKTCWLTPDLLGPASGSNVIAEEEFTHYLIDKGLCKLVEKHPDDIAGYTWPKEEVCPCGANVTPCGLQCSAKAEPSGGVPGMPAMPGLGGGAPAGDDNNRSTDKLVERYKKSQLVDKLIIYRIDELNKDRAIIHFRISDAKANSNGNIEFSQTYVIAPKVEVTEGPAQ